MPQVREITPEEYLSDPAPAPSPLQIPKTRIKNAVLQSPGEFGGFIIQCIIGLGLIGFGAINAGSAFTTATHMSGILATLFYTYQGGTILISAGSILIYDAIKKVR